MSGAESRSVFQYTPWVEGCERGVLRRPSFPRDGVSHANTRIQIRGLKMVVDGPTDRDLELISGYSARLALRSTLVSYAVFVQKTQILLITHAS